jgi:hypothetical protein
MHIETYLAQLTDKRDYSQAELDDIRTVMNLFAIDAIVGGLGIELEICDDLQRLRTQ